MKPITLIAIAFTCLPLTSVFSQEVVQDGEEELRLTAKDSIVEKAWTVGLGYNFVDDSGDMADELFAFKTQWNAVPYPTRFNFGRYFKSGIGIEGIATYNRYKEGKIVDNMPNPEEKSYFGLDARFTYDLNKIIGETAWFDPYLGVGLGYTEANNRPRGTYNGVIGFRTWFSDHWGLDLNSSGKWSMNTGDASNHLQHAAAVVYRFGIEKGLSNKGEEKLALIEALKAEKQRKQDSIAEVDRQREAAALAERLAKEKEAAQLAAAEKARKDAENRRKRQLESQIADLGMIYFKFDSSYLTDNSKTILDKIAAILNQNEDVTLQVGSHTDSRGASKYNEWLSSRRVERTVGYLIEQGISPGRLNGQGYGETQLQNECDDHTYCSEAKHRLNRRSEFTVQFSNAY
ncbi:OmpA family protein [Pricia sp. S334]|uniref:OmpA family protein n=1 Tax=Pricia mediterranea TaxID=3076079 RepID=A0ABU3LAG7_9FLAO|nr:OmpA family protein [Pricia sp. S334]MDT7830184.1 OmpA family protein [Pricia sp. S334]